MVQGLAASGLAWRYGAKSIGLPAFIGEELLVSSAVITVF